MSGYRAVIAALQSLRKGVDGGGLTVGGALDSLQDAGFFLIAILIALPFLQPFIPLGPLSTAGGLAFILLGLQLLSDFREPYLPERIRRAPLPPAITRRAIAVAVGVLRGCRRYTRARYPRWVSGRKGRKVLGSIILAAGMIMVVPFFGIPLNDFFPALAVVSACLGELEQDGLMVLVALGWLAVGALYCALLLILLATLGWEAVRLLFG